MLALICIGIVACCHYVGPASWYAMSALWGICMMQMYRERNQNLRRQHVILLTTFVLSCLALFPKTDVFSDDAHRYRWDGWVATHGIDPYSAAPTDSSLRLLAHTAGAVRYPESINNNTLKTIYPPAAQHVFAAIVRVCGTEPLAFKLGWISLCLMMIALTIWLLWSDLHLLSRYLGVLISPIILLHGFLDIHVDIMMALAAMLALVLLHKGGWLAMIGSSIYGVSIAFKYLPALLLPVFLQRNIGEKGAFLQRSTIIVTTIALLYTPFIHSDVLGSLGVFAKVWQANSLPAWIGNLWMEQHITRIVLMVLAAVTMLVVLGRWRSNLMWATSLCMTVLLAFSPVVHPWYLALPLVLFVLAPSRASIVWTITMCAYAYTYTNYKGYGVWHDHPVALAIEYVPVLVALTLDVVQGPLLLGNEHRMRLRAGVDR